MDTELLNIFKFVVTALIPLMLVIATRPNIGTLFSSSKSERLLLSKELRLIYSLFTITFLWVLTPMMFASDLKDNHPKIYDFINTNPQIIFSVIIIGFLLSIALYYLVSKFKVFSNNKIVSKSKIGKFYYFLFPIVIIFYIPTLCVTYGIVVIETFQSSNFELFITYTSILTLMYYHLFLRFIRKFFKIILHQDIMIEIVLNNGTQINNAYLLHPTYGNKILIGNHPHAIDCTETFVISQKNIEYIRFFISNTLPESRIEATQIKIKDGSITNKFKRSSTRNR